MCLFYKSSKEHIQIVPKCSCNVYVSLNASITIDIQLSSAITHIYHYYERSNS